MIDFRVSMTTHLFNHPWECFWKDLTVEGKPIPNVGSPNPQSGVPAWMERRQWAECQLSSLSAPWLGTHCDSCLLPLPPCFPVLVSCAFELWAEVNPSWSYLIETNMIILIGIFKLDPHFLNCWKLVPIYKSSRASALHLGILTRHSRTQVWGVVSAFSLQLKWGFQALLFVDGLIKPIDFLCTVAHAFNPSSQ